MGKIESRSQLLLMMQYFIFTITLCFAAAEHHREAWRTALCEGNEELKQGIDVCFELETRDVQDLTRNCVQRVLPSSNGDLKYFTKIACADGTLFDKADDCYHEHEIFKKEVATNKAAIVCYEHLFQKHGILELENFFKNLEDTTTW